MKQLRCMVDSSYGGLRSQPTKTIREMVLISRLVYLNERKNFEMKMLSLKFLHIKTGKVRIILIYTLQPSS